MNTITPTQLDALGEEARRRSLARLAAHLQQVFPEWASRSPKVYRDAAEQAAADADAFGIRHEREVGTFAVFQGEYGRRFEQKPEHGWARRILETPDLDGRVKMERLLAGMRQGPAHAEPQYADD